MENAGSKKLEFKKALDKSLRLLAHSDRTIYEIKSRLKRDEYSDEVIDEVIEYLLSEHFLDDKRFAEYYVVCYQSKRSRRRIQKDLTDKGIDDSTVESVMQECDDTEALMKSFNKQLCKYNVVSDGEIPWEVRQKVSAALYRQGFSSESISKLFNINLS